MRDIYVAPHTCFLFPAVTPQFYHSRIATDYTKAEPVLNYLILTFFIFTKPIFCSNRFKLEPNIVCASPLNTSFLKTRF